VRPSEGHDESDSAGGVTRIGLKSGLKF
jgi:hypothetical protein